MGNAERFGDLAGQIAQSPKMIEAAFAIFVVEAPLMQRLLAGVVRRVRDAICDRTGWHMAQANIGAGKHSGLLVGLATDATVGIGIQFDYARHGYLLCRVAGEEGRPLPTGVKPVIQALMESEASTKYWPVWKRVGPNDRHFPLSQQTDREFWISARDSRLAGVVIRFVGEVEAALRRADLLDAVRARLSGRVGTPR